MTSILQQRRALEELVTHHLMITEELRRLEFESRTRERIDSMRTITRDLKHTPKLNPEDTGLDKLEEALKESLKKRRW